MKVPAAVLALTLSLGACAGHAPSEAAPALAEPCVPQGIARSFYGSSGGAADGYVSLDRVERLAITGSGESLQVTAVGDDRQADATRARTPAEIRAQAANANATCRPAASTSTEPQKN